MAFDKNIATAFGNLPDMIMEGAGPYELFAVANTGSLPKQPPSQLNPTPNPASASLPTFNELIASGVPPEEALLLSVEIANEKTQQAMMDIQANNGMITTVAAQAFNAGPQIQEHMDSISDIFGVSQKDIVEEITKINQDPPNQLVQDMSPKRNLTADEVAQATPAHDASLYFRSEELDPLYEERERDFVPIDPTTPEGQQISQYRISGVPKDPLNIGQTFANARTAVQEKLSPTINAIGNIFTGPSENGAPGNGAPPSGAPAYGSYADIQAAWAQGKINGDEVTESIEELWLYIESRKISDTASLKHPIKKEINKIKNQLWTGLPDSIKQAMSQNTPKGEPLGLGYKKEDTPPTQYSSPPPPQAQTEEEYAGWFGDLPSPPYAPSPTVLTNEDRFLLEEAGPAGLSEADIQRREAMGQHGQTLGTLEQANEFAQKIEEVKWKYLNPNRQATITDDRVPFLGDLLKMFNSPEGYNYMKWYHGDKLSGESYEEGYDAGIWLAENLIHQWNTEEAQRSLEEGKADEEVRRLEEERLRLEREAEAAAQAGELERARQLLAEAVAAAKAAEAAPAEAAPVVDYMKKAASDKTIINLWSSFNKAGVLGNMNAWIKPLTEQLEALEITDPEQQGRIISGFASGALFDKATTATTTTAVPAVAAQVAAVPVVADTGLSKTLPVGDELKQDAINALVINYGSMPEWKSFYSGSDHMGRSLYVLGDELVAFSDNRVFKIGNLEPIDTKTARLTWGDQYMDLGGTKDTATGAWQFVGLTGPQASVTGITGSPAASTAASGGMPPMPGLIGTGALSPPETWTSMRAQQMGDDVYNPRLWGARYYGYKPARGKFQLSGSMHPFGQFLPGLEDVTPQETAQQWESLVDVSRRLGQSPEGWKTDPLTIPQFVQQGYLSGEGAKSSIINMALAASGATGGIGAAAFERSLSSLYDVYEAQALGRGDSPGGFVGWLAQRLAPGTIPGSVPPQVAQTVASPVVAQLPYAPYMPQGEDI
jgi:hypothetical protein